MKLRSECYPWPGSVDANGYAIVQMSGRPRRSVRVHRLVYEATNGQVPVELDVDHVCHNLDLTCDGGRHCPHRRCVNPGHLRAVSRRDNTLAGRGPCGRNSRKTECSVGHPYSPENTYTYFLNGWPQRKCRTCQRIRARAAAAFVRHAKLTPDQVRAIRASSAPQDALAKEYGVGQSTISRVIRGASWAHV